MNQQLCQVVEVSLDRDGLPNGIIRTLGDPLPWEQAHRVLTRLLSQHSHRAFDWVDARTGRFLSFVP